MGGEPAHPVLQFDQCPPMRLLKLEFRDDGCAICHGDGHNVAVTGFLGRLQVVDKLTLGGVIAQARRTCRH